VIDVSKEKALQLLRVMYAIRAFELRMQAIFRQRAEARESVGALHSCEGQEAVAAGVGACLRKDDYQFSTHRGHGHAIAKGLDLKRMAAEMLGKAAGCSGGRGGSMHLFDLEIGLMGGNGIVGGGLPLALGAAYSAQYRGTDQVTVCYFGDGAASQGAAHESINMAAVHRLPIVYVCENNLYAATSHVSRNCPVEHIADRAAGYGIPGEVVDGNDVLAVRRAASKAVARAGQGQGPTLLECKTYRHRPHCMLIPEHRPAEEREAWQGRDPIRRFEEQLGRENMAARDELERLAGEVETELAEAIAFAEQSPAPDPQTVCRWVWAD
jgi:pyruvate dehydrogenase E1 component alpha subunit